ncbi:MAG: hypothetical protein ABIO35_08445 [Nitrobacter sp.]
MTDRPLNYPPPWQDSVTLSKHLCVSANTVDNWVAQGIIPAPRKRGGKLMWKWSEVDQKLTVGAADEPSDLAERVRNGTRRQAENRFGH